MIVNDTSDDMITLMRPMRPMSSMGFPPPNAMYRYPTRDAKENSEDMTPPRIGLNDETKLPYYDAGFAEFPEAPPAYSIQ